MKKLLFTVLAAAVLAALPGRAHAQARLTFTGGNATPLTFSLSSPISFVITTAPTTSSSPIFDFQGVGNLFPVLGSYQDGNATIAYSVNGGPAIVVNTTFSGQTNGSYVATDLLFGTPNAALAVGNTVVLGVGKFTTQFNFAAAPPASGAYPTFIVDVNGVRLTAANGVSVVPEPSTWALLAVGVGLLGVKSAVALSAPRRLAPMC